MTLPPEVSLRGDTLTFSAKNLWLTTTVTDLGSLTRHNGTTAQRPHCAGHTDIVLDNWGAVTKWHAQGAVTSWGPSSIGFVNFGNVRTVRAVPGLAHGTAGLTIGGL